MMLIYILIITNLVPVKIESVVPEWIVGQPAVILKDTAKNRILPIFIGESEANAIDMALKGVKPPRPQTHDLLVRVIEALGSKLQKIIITNLEENIFFAEIHLLTSNKNLKRIDSRPSDAIALALRTKTPIYVEEVVFKKYEKSIQTLPQQKKRETDL